MRDVLYLTVGGFAWAVAIYKARAWLRDRSNTNLALVSGMIAAVGLLMTLSSPRLYLAFDQAVGVANLAMAVIYSSAVAFVLGARILLLSWMLSDGKADPVRDRQRTRWVIAATVAAWTVALVAFATHRPYEVEHPRDFTSVYADAPGVAIFLVIYLAIFGTCMASLGGLCRRYAAELQAGRPWMARGLRLIAYGSLAILAYCAAKLVGMVCHWSGVDLDMLTNSVAPLSASLGALLVVAGFAVPTLGSRMTAWRLVRRLHPLWRRVTADEPEVQMEELRWWWPSKSMHWVASRQMTEIRDVQRGIRQYVEAALIDTARERGSAAGLGEQELVALVEATALRRGLHNRKRGHIPDHSAATVVMGGGEQLANEHAHLVRVSDAYNNPLVGEILTAIPMR
ncbi:MAB_1171c family putative transporter [Streptomyces europaeiscabiei]|uniref:MAB_1171c family putative transporter n=1 Tax=Streptomyces europaeiscabiei TaxID=146819 RepID=UPI0029BC23E4|nr:MAB_1171c family putative transporter [Streptomyces europaeiscabiei]MDX3584200.1 hypothetical protein [Streptomyces europaeiscabiei]